MTHAFFKALLFLAAGIIIESLHHEHNIFRMGGLRNELPIAFWTFLHRRMFSGRTPADHRRLLQQGPHPVERRQFGAGSTAFGRRVSSASG